MLVTGLRTGCTEYRIQAAVDFLICRHVQADSGAHLASISSCRSVTLATHLHLVPCLRRSGAIPLLHGLCRDSFTFACQTFSGRLLRTCTYCGQTHSRSKGATLFNPLKPELNPICYLLALLAHHYLHVSRIRVKSLTLRLLMSYIYGAPILDVSRSHTTTQHSR